MQDEDINRLTIIANESYEDFAKSLQKEFEKDFGIRFGVLSKICFAKITRNENDEEKVIGQDESKAIWNNLLEAGYINESGEIQNSFDPQNSHFELKIDEQYEDIKPTIIDEIQRYIFKNRIANTRDRIALKINEQMLIQPEFLELWDKIKCRTRYSIHFDTNKLIEQAVEQLKKLEEIKPIRITQTRVELDISNNGVRADRKLEERNYKADTVKVVLPDLLAHLQKKTELTRHTLVKILKKSGRLPEFQNNPQKFITLTAQEISKALHTLMLDGIKYEKIDDYWEMSRIEQDSEEGIERYKHNLYQPVKNQEKSLFNAIAVDSEVEKQFAKDLDDNERIHLFVKLPAWFKIDTPIGAYNPDWAFVTKDEKLYFVCETKSTMDTSELRRKEEQKIECGKKHFREIEVDYKVVTKLSDVEY